MGTDEERSPRLVAWLDGLTAKERGEAEFVLGLEGGTQADAHIGIRLMKLEDRTAFKDGVTALGMIGSIIGSALAAFFAGSHGVPRP